MRIPSWFRPLAARSALAPKRKRPAPHRLMLEVLETRDCPSGGLLDPTFNGTGTETFPLSEINMVSTAVQPDGKIVAVGSVNGKHGAELAVVRLNPDGTPDKTFNGTGSEALSVFPYGRAVAFQPDGKILVGGQAFTGHNYDDEYAVTRLNADGSLDTTFGNRGVWILNHSSVPNSEKVDKLAVLTDPNHPSVVTGIIVGGEGVAADGIQDGVAAIKLTPNGALDSTFGSGGVFTFHIGSLMPNSYCGMAVTASGEIFLASSARLPNPDGTSTAYGLLVDVNSTGHLNTAFNGTGYLVDNPGGAFYTAFHAVAAQGNAIVVAGFTENGPVGEAGTHQTGVLARYTLTGAVDLTFGTAGYYLMDPGPGYDVQFTDLQLEADGSIVVCGSSTDLNGLTSLIVGQLSADGAVDTSFGSSGTGFTYLANWGQGRDGTRISIGPDGKIVINGALEIARYTAP